MSVGSRYALKLSLIVEYSSMFVNYLSVSYQDFFFHFLKHYFLNINFLCLIASMKDSEFTKKNVFVYFMFIYVQLLFTVRIIHLVCYVKQDLLKRFCLEFLL